MRSLADKFRETLLNNYDQAQREIGLEAPDFLHVLDVHGAVDAARQTVRGLGAGVDVRRALRQGKRLELSIEASMLRPEFAPLFTPAELAAARDALFQYGYRASWDTSARTSVRPQTRSEPAAAEIPPVPRSALVMALEVFDRERRKAPEWHDWERRSTLRKALRHDGRLYPIKEILRMATGAGEDTRDEDAVDYVRKRGFDVLPLARPEPEPEQPAPEREPAALEPEPPAKPATVRGEQSAELAAPVPATSTTPAGPPAGLPDDEREDMLVALEIFDGDERALPEWLDWESIAAEPLALAYEGRLYPAAEIIRLATGSQEALTAEQAAGYLRRHGFDVVAPRPTVAEAPHTPAPTPAPAPRTPGSTHDIAATVKAYAALVQCDLHEHLDWLRDSLELGMLLDESPLLDAGSREKLGLARFLWVDLESRRAVDFAAPALLLIDVLERAAAQALRGAAVPSGMLDGTLEGLVAHRAAVESALAGWQAHIALGQPYTAAQWLDVLPIVTAIRARAASGEPLSPAAFQELIDVLRGSPLCGAGALNGLLSACNAVSMRAAQ